MARNQIVLDQIRELAFFVFHVHLYDINYY